MTDEYALPADPSPQEEDRATDAIPDETGIEPGEDDPAVDHEPVEEDA